MVEKTAMCVKMLSEIPAPSKPLSKAVCRNPKMTLPAIKKAHKICSGTNPDFPSLIKTEQHFGIYNCAQKLVVGWIASSTVKLNKVMGEEKTEEQKNLRNLEQLRTALKAIHIPALLKGKTDVTGKIYSALESHGKKSDQMNEFLREAFSSLPLGKGYDNYWAASLVYYVYSTVLKQGRDKAIGVVNQLFRSWVVTPPRLD